MLLSRKFFFFFLLSVSASAYEPLRCYQGAPETARLHGPFSHHHACILTYYVDQEYALASTAPIRDPYRYQAVLGSYVVHDHYLCGQWTDAFDGPRVQCACFNAKCNKIVPMDELFDKVDNEKLHMKNISGPGVLDYYP